MGKITWHIETRKLSELKPYHKNPRAFTVKGMADLSKSLAKFGLADYPVINMDGTIIGGHARVKVLESEGITECDCNVPNRKLTDKEVEELNIRLNANEAGEWDTDILANQFDEMELQDWGLDLKLDGKEGQDSEVYADRSIQLMPKREYLVIMCNETNDEWDEIKERLKLKMVRRGGYKANSPFSKTSIERIITAKRLLELLK